MASLKYSKEHLRAVKRRRTGSMQNTTGASRDTSQEPDVKAGIDYWETQPASLDGVLGTLPDFRIQTQILTDSS